MMRRASLSLLSSDDDDDADDDHREARVGVSGGGGSDDAGSTTSLFTSPAASDADGADGVAYLPRRGVYHVDTPERLHRRRRTRLSTSKLAASDSATSTSSTLRNSSTASFSTSAPVTAPTTAANGVGETGADSSSPSASTPPQAPASKLSWMGCFVDQLRLDRGDADAAEMQRELEFTTAQIKSAFKLIANFERLIFLGVWTCLDLLLDLVCIVPVKAALALVSLIFVPITRRPVPLQYFARLAVAGLGMWFVSFIDLSYVYHNIRGQSAIKLYVIFNMCEVFEKLFATFSLDAMDALVLRSTRYKTALDVLLLPPRVIFTVVPVICHTLALLYQILALNVAINSHNTALLTIIISNQFLEIKGTVFKRLDKSGLFQYTCADMRERFQYICVLSLIGVRNMAGYHWDTDYFANTLMWSLLAAMSSEVFVDVFKHTFLTRFNGIDTKVYKSYEHMFANSVVGGTASLHTREGRARRMQRQLGYLAEPLVLLTFKFMHVSLPWVANLSWVYWVIAFVALFVFKAAQRWLLELYCHWRLTRLSKQDNGPVNVHLFGAANYRDITTATGADAVFPLGPHDRFGKRIN
ncbi:hypothetical protein PTSG_11633 [Salpingoeca rosetta]|uniref:Transmembrane anterior posterior transformation protein 1 n=1 Tax=Salpingoeca rosetta (strain ATCC 50818 / BSB-021) TaxID=946362 RepID=F2TX98_SALR5|nr:uncharacterized protein PTSG_11633 [Salpingoeca rosetta]EGD76007.1 hypothetical protein PTSG_11633 [Salpingoeca rosetta]|eukprot:XP_004998182.1 hypothetical protein PTSG_11633 [Salpingoeca rosetta]